MYITRMLVKDIWEKEQSGHGFNREALEQSIKNIEHQIEQLFDRIVKAESETLIRAYETKVMKLETEKASLEAKMSNCDSSPLSFEQSFQTVFDFLENPQKLWHSDDLLDRRLLLKLVFTRPLAYRRNEGFQTACIAQPFGLSGQLINDNSVMVVGKGLGANLLVDFVDALYDVGRIFESPVVVQDKQFKFQPMHFPTKSPSLSKRTYEQWQKWFEETIEKQQMAA